jgi:hypothetical protein
MGLSDQEKYHEAFVGKVHSISNIESNAIAFSMLGSNVISCNFEF